MLDNLVDFDAENLCAPDALHELDRWAITRLNALIEKVFAAYNDYEFHVITHAVNDFCVLDLSSFYFDIIKDRLYCDEASGESRRAAQTTLYIILDTLTRLFAPILAFTCNEVWLSMPHRKEDDARNVVFNEMHKTFDAYALDEDSMAQWDALRRLREGVNAALEAARAEKKIGKALEAHVTLVDGSGALDALKARFGGEWADVFIVSDVEVSADGALAAQGAPTAIDGVSVIVSEAKGEKCPRCWKHSTEANGEGLCPRCAAVCAKIAQF